MLEFYYVFVSLNGQGKFINGGIFLSIEEISRVAWASHILCQLLQSLLVMIGCNVIAMQGLMVI